MPHLFQIFHHGENIEPGSPFSGCSLMAKTHPLILSQHVEVNHRLRCAYRCPDTFGTELGRMKAGPSAVAFGAGNGV